MSRPAPPTPAKLVIGMISGDRSLAEKVATALLSVFGEPDLISPWWPFDFTEYYRREMGAPLFRRMMSFNAGIDQAHLPDIKQITNQLEIRFSRTPAKRLVNIDPGYLLPERFVLASGKNFTHRIYIGKGIYADLTLIFQKGTFVSLPWTYPDYADDRIQSFLHQARNKLLADLRSGFSINWRPQDR
jgi:hypothetical protein